MILYKVWIHIEAIDKSNDKYHDIDEPQEAGRFDSEQEARRLVDQMLSRSDPSATQLHIAPPPNEDNLYRVVYIIDVNGANAMGAARVAHQTMTDPKALSPVLLVLDPEGNETTIDLSSEST